jgi:dihydroorotate dehydrogenase
MLETPDSRKSVQGDIGWKESLTTLGTAFLRLLPAEVAHDLGIFFLKHHKIFDFLFAPEISNHHDLFQVDLPGIGRLPHPIGLAAGFDKNAVCPTGLKKLGFSFLEVGTITPRSQDGNAKPRLFRQSDQLGLVNRMGFNNQGVATVSRRLKSLAWNHKKTPLGINVGKNKKTRPQDAIEDYVLSLQAFSNLGRYFVINISSPNTPGLRDLANKAFVETLALRLGPQVSQTWFKLDPDMTKSQFQKLIEAIAAAGFPGVILTNTHRVEKPHSGGQSGHPIALMSTRCLEWAWDVHRGTLGMIGGGGILSGLDIFEKMIRGANAVQIYTALVYRGPWVVVKLLRELHHEMALRGYTKLDQLPGQFYQE